MDGEADRLITAQHEREKARVTWVRVEGPRQQNSWDRMDISPRVSHKALVKAELQAASDILGCNGL